MKSGVDFKELKEIEKRILKGIKLEDTISNPKTVGAFDIAYTGEKYKCVAIVIDIKSKEVIEEKSVIGDEIMPYFPNLATFREGPVILDAYRALEKKPDVLLVKGLGSVHPNKVGLASYVGVMLNKSCFGVSKDLNFARLDEDKIMFNGELKGYAIKAKPYANPIYVTPGHNISIRTCVEIVKKTMSEKYKLPLPLHLAHKQVNKLKGKENGIYSG